jgi:copper homeostasis protein CutC
MPGGGINASNLAALYAATKAREFHLSATSQVKSRMVFKKHGISMGKSTSDEYDIQQTDKDLVMEVCNVASGLDLKL